MSKTKDSSKLGNDDKLENRPLADGAMDGVSGGFFADYVKQLLANSEPGRGSSFLNSFAKALSDAGK